MRRQIDMFWYREGVTQVTGMSPRRAEFWGSAVGAESGDGDLKGSDGRLWGLKEKLYPSPFLQPRGCVALAILYKTITGLVQED